MLSSPRRPTAAAGTVGRPSQYNDPLEPPPLDGAGKVGGRASAILTKALKEAAVLKRRAQFKWKHLSQGVLSFTANGEQRTFAIGKKLGEGGYSTIWRVHEWQPDGSERQYAVKRVILDRRDPDQVALVEHEIEVMRSLPPHPNVVELIGTCKRQRGGTGGGEQGLDEHFFLLELCRGGSLAEMLIARGEANAPLSAAEVARAFYDMALGVAHMHDRSPPLAHRDVKPENFILSDSDGRWRLCDFGSTTSRSFLYRDGMTQGDLADEEDRIHRYSTPQYRAPEMCDLRRAEPINHAVDVWALGVSLYKLLFLKDLLEPGEEKLGTLNFDPAKKLAPRALPPIKPDSAASHPALLDLLRLCLTPSARSRPTATAILQFLHAKAADLSPAMKDSFGGGHLSPGAARHHHTLPSWPFDRPAGAHTSGLLTISSLHARDLYPKSATGAGVKPYVLFTCGGVRHTTRVAAKGHGASWHVSLSAATHAMQIIELTVWAYHKRTTHDFLGVVSLDLPSLLGDPTMPCALEGRVMPLQRRSHKSRVAGELCFSLSWEPFAAANGDGGAAAVAAAQQPFPATAAPLQEAKPPSPHLISSTSPAGAAAGAAGGAAGGSFWAASFADEFSSFDPIATTPIAASSMPAAMPMQQPPVAPAASGFGAGNFWDTAAPTQQQQQQQQQQQPSPFGSPPPPMAGASASFGSSPPVFTPTAQRFDSVDTLAAPWDPQKGGGDAGSFWAAFDASPQVAPSGLPAPAAGRPQQHAAAFDAFDAAPAVVPAAAASPTSPSLIDLQPQVQQQQGGTATQGPAGSFWESDLAQLQ